MAAPTSENRIWRNFRDFLQHFLSDPAKTVLILVGLVIIWEVIKVMAYLGLPKESLDKLEAVHFVFTYVAVVVISIAFILRLILSLWKTQ
jgi:hypothetical protein